MTATLLNSISHLPSASNTTGKEPEWVEFCEKSASGPLAAVLAHPQGEALIRTLYGHSPFLWQLLRKHAEFFTTLCIDGLEAARLAVSSTLNAAPPITSDTDSLMRQLRLAKGQVALLTAVADITGIWRLEDVTRQLSEFAEDALTRMADHLLSRAHVAGDIVLPNPENPSEGSGFIILGMGKLGAYELNYSSDVDLIILYEPEALRYTGRMSLQHLMNKITHELLRGMQERTSEGYVFRTDIRLRPDPASTPPAMSIHGALTYYESVGQNWERAAMIKARPVGGDKAAGERYLKQLTPFIWRRNLDFAAIADIHSIKRQIDHKAGTHIQLAGHHVKLGAGGIREIEFYAQVQQLIWGGRNPKLRTRGTCQTLELLHQVGQVPANTMQELLAAYRYLRMVEHRLQMTDDQQTHQLPTKREALAEIAEFCGFETLEGFERETLKHLRTVKQHYAKLYSVEQPLGQGGSLVFTGVDPDPETLQTLSSLGFSNTRMVCETIMGWHRGSRRATRNKRARELLTELTPELLTALGRTAQPDAAFLHFDEFLGKLPAGVQLFSLFNANRQLLNLIANLMGSAPRLAEILSRTPYLLDAVLTGRFYARLPDQNILREELNTILSLRSGQDDVVNILCSFKNEYEFQTGIQLLNRYITAREVGHFLSILAETVVQALLERTLAEFAASYGTLPDSALSVIGLGKLGAQEFTFSSDLDLIFVYHTADPDAVSSGARPFSASVYYNRFCQRLVGALTSLSREGRLYEVDTRLRPLGGDGPLASSFEACAKYYTEDAWTFEFMALSRARPVAGDTALGERTRAQITDCLRVQRDAEKLRFDIASMREKVEKERTTSNPWDIKYIRGGLMDLDFLAQYLLLKHAPTHPQVLATHSPDVFAGLASAHLLPQEDAQQLRDSAFFLQHVQAILRLCSESGTLDEATTPEGLKRLLHEQFDLPSFTSLKSRLLEAEETVYSCYQKFIGAADAPPPSNT